MSEPSTGLKSTKHISKNKNEHTGWLASVDPQVVGLVIALAGLVALFGSQVPDAFFFTPINMLSIGEGVTLVGLTALAEMTVMIMGGLDISIGSMVGICSAAAGVAMLDVVNTPGGALIGILAAVSAGLIGGLLNGVIVTKGKIDPIIVTLGTYSAYRGVALLITGNGYAVNVRNDAFNSYRDILCGRYPALYCDPARGDDHLPFLSAIYHRRTQHFCYRRQSCRRSPGRGQSGSL